MYDLHIHSNYSDGTWSVKDLIDYSVGLNLKAIAISDHDSVLAIDEAISYAQNRIKIIPSVEISTSFEYLNEIYEFHILGYFINHHSDSLIKLLNLQRQNRYYQYTEILENIKQKDQNIKLDIEDFYNINSQKSIGMSHLTRALAKFKNISEYEAYKKYICKTSSFYVARKMVSLEECINTIHKSNGLAFLAHPSDLGAKIKPIVLKAKKFGLDGIEIYHSYHSTYQTQYYKNIAREHNLLYSGGSDCHGPYHEFKPLTGQTTINEFEFNLILSRVKNL